MDLTSSAILASPPATTPDRRAPAAAPRRSWRACQLCRARVPERVAVLSYLACPRCAKAVKELRP